MYVFNHSFFFVVLCFTHSKEKACSFVQRDSVFCLQASHPAPPLRQQLSNWCCLVIIHEMVYRLVKSRVVMSLGRTMGGYIGKGKLKVQ